MGICVGRLVSLGLWMECRKYLTFCWRVVVIVAMVAVWVTAVRVSLVRLVGRSVEAYWDLCLL